MLACGWGDWEVTQPNKDEQRKYVMRSKVFVAMLGVLVAGRARAPWPTV